VPFLRPCIEPGCPALIREGSRCRKHRLKQKPRKRRRSAARGSGGIAEKFRRAVLAKTGGRCAVCGSTDSVEAHHVVPLASGGSNHPANGIALCRKHHLAAGRKLSELRRRARTH
jgi:predicted restriction endonuclease